MSVAEAMAMPLALLGSTGSAGGTGLRTNRRAWAISSGAGSLGAMTTRTPSLVSL